ncbi:MAG TPA: tetratricopeptide repeat protein [Myxococcota bacterium]|nr:tetratricopeptide repeat protein [Myxococcota bacterium]HRY97258.1 tetratricopeptide repeat protein [Myxococcota bacterium]
MELSRAFPLDCCDADEIVPGLLACMSAPPRDRARAWPCSWRGWCAGGLAGVVLGCLAYALGPGSSPATGPAPTPARSAAPGLVALPTQVATAVTAEPEGPEAPARPEPNSFVPALVPVKNLDKHAGPVRHRVAKALARPLSPAYRTLMKSGWQKYGSGRFDAAAVAFGRAVHLEQRHAAGYYGLALALFEQGQEDAALKVLERGAKRTGSKSELWLLAGSIYQWKGKERPARMAYARYLTDHPRGPYAHDVKVILAYESLPALLPFGDEESSEMLADTE